jgi:DNA mismatch endonuclease (patch repair protein)
MADVFSKDQRSSIMRQVKGSRNKSTEIKLIHIFKELSIKGWRRNYRLFGKPDIVFIQSKLAIFIDGCFWHGHNCRNTKPKDNQEYWTQKINRNIQRDNLVNDHLTKKGWTVIRFWECELKNTKTIQDRLPLNST